jgi:hypothetical protein
MNQPPAGLTAGCGIFCQLALALFHLEKIMPENQVSQPDAAQPAPTEAEILTAAVAALRYYIGSATVENCPSCGRLISPESIERHARNCSFLRSDVMEGRITPPAAAPAPAKIASTAGEIGRFASMIGSQRIASAFKIGTQRAAGRIIDELA